MDEVIFISDGIYSVISEVQLRDILQTLQAYTNIPICLIGTDGRRILHFGEETGFCQLLKKSAFTDSACLSLQVKAGLRAKELGEAYIFSCLGNLNHIAFPLIYQEELLGTVILGPFLMDAPDSTLVSEVAETHRLSPTRSLELYDELGGLQIVTPPRVQLLKKLLDYLLSPLIPAERIMLMQSQEKAFQQSKINETIQRYKEQSEPTSSEYFYKKEKQLLTRVRTGNVQEVKALLNDLLGYVLFSQGGSLESVRIRSIELTTLLSRVAIDGGAQAELISDLSNKLLPAMFHEPDLDSLCLRLQEMVESFMKAMFQEQDKGNLSIRRALRYMADHYSEKLELNDVAEYVQLSPSYFSTLFHQVVGISFREQLSRIRVEESKLLLLSTDYPLAEIAVSVGFPDQSYYCKVFKRIVGLTPRKFRG